MKATLDSFPNYWFNMFLMPIGIWREIDKIRRSFFWGDEVSEEAYKRKLHAINWETLCLKKQEGGLNIANLRFRNGSMLAKWVWRIHSERGKFWNSTMVALYGKQSVFDIFHMSEAQLSSSFFKSLYKLKDWKMMHDILDNKNFPRTIRSGSTTLFWFDSWHPMGILRVSLEKIFEISNCQNEAVDYVVAKMGSGFRWWSREVLLDERDEVEKFFEIIHFVQLSSAGMKLVGC